MKFIVTIEGFAGEKLARRENGQVTVDSMDDFKLALKPSFSSLLQLKDGAPVIHFNIPLNTSSERTEFLRINTDLVRKDGTIRSINIYTEDGFEKIENILKLYFPEAFVCHT